MACFLNHLVTLRVNIDVHHMICMYFRLPDKENRPVNVIEKVMEDGRWNSEEWNLFRQDFTDEQDVAIGSPRAAGLAGGLALLAFQLLLPLLNFSSL